MKTVCKFSHRSDDGKVYYWQGPRIPGDSRSELISCGVEWFWNYQPSGLKRKVKRA